MFRIEVWNNWPDGEVLSTVDMDPTSTEGEQDAAARAAKTTAEQMLGKFGMSAKLRVITIPEAMSSEEVAAEVAAAHAKEAAGGELPTTDDIVGRFLDPTHRLDMPAAEILAALETADPEHHS